MANINNLKYKPEYCKMLIEHMRQGKSYDSFPVVIYKKDNVIVGTSTLYDWEARYPEWKEAKLIAVNSAFDFFETRAIVKTSGQKIDGINPKDIDSYVLMGIMRTRFHKIYGDKTQVTNLNTEVSYEQYLKDLENKNG